MQVEGRDPTFSIACIILEGVGDIANTVGVKPRWDYMGVFGRVCQEQVMEFRRW